MTEYLDVLPLRASPEEVQFDEYDEEGIKYSKEGAEDGDLWPYIFDNTVRIGESPQFDHDILLKRVENKTHETVDDVYRELAFALLFDELGYEDREIFPNVYFATRLEGDLHYGMEFKSAGMPYYDLSPNNFDRAKEYIEEAGEDMGIMKWLGVQHGDLIQTNVRGVPKMVPTPKNIMFHADDPESVIIDPEDATWSDERSQKDIHKSGLLEMNTITSEGEYMAVRNALMATTLLGNKNILDFFDELSEVELRDREGRPRKNLIIKYNPDNGQGLPGETLSLKANNDPKMIDFEKLLDREEELAGEPNARLEKKIQEMRAAYERGFEQGTEQAYKGALDESSIGTRPFLRNIRQQSDVPTDIDFQDIENKGISDVAKDRWDEVYEFLNNQI